MAGNQNSAKGNPASKRMMNPNNKNKRAKNKAKNENLRAKGIHPKQLRRQENENLHLLKKKFGVGRNERRKFIKQEDVAGQVSFHGLNADQAKLLI